MDIYKCLAALERLGSDTSQNSVQDFEIPDFRVGSQISKKDFRFHFHCEWAVNKVVKTMTNEDECESGGESKDKEGCENCSDCKDLQN